MSEFSSAVPPTKLLLRCKSEIQSYIGPPGTSLTEIPFTLARDPILSTEMTLRISPVFSPCGSFVALAPDLVDQPILIRRTESGEVVREIPCMDAQSIDFSPLGTYLVTWSPRSQLKSESEVPNMRIWRVSDGEMVAGHCQKVNKKDAIQWNDDESFFFKLVTNEVQIFDGRNIKDGFIARVHKKGLSQFSAAPSAAPPALAIFSPELKGNPGNISIYLKASNSSGYCDSPVASRSLMAASEATMLWNCSGTAVLVHTHSDVDHSNSSYYGTSGLFILNVDGVSEAVSRSKEGPMHDVKWCPTSDIFIVAAGSMPSHCTLYNGRGVPLFEFGAAHRNSVCWAPHGSFVAVAGFGNLAGEIDFYQVKDEKRCVKMGTNNAHCTIKYGWSPDSRYFMTATVAPRMNVDNGVKIFKYNGVGPVVDHRVEGPTLFDASFRPAPPGVYPDRPRTPTKSSADSHVATAQLVKAAPVKAAPYRPPGSTGTLSSLLAREAAPRGVVKPQQPQSSPKPIISQQRVIPGMPPEMAARKVKPPKAQQAEIKPPTSSAVKVETKIEAKPTKVFSTSSTSAALAVAAPAILSAEDKEKKAKGIEKKLRQIEEIEMKRASGSELNSDQQNKLASKSLLEKELKELRI